MREREKRHEHRQGTQGEGREKDALHSSIERFERAVNTVMTRAVVLHSLMRENGVRWVRQVGVRSFSPRAYGPSNKCAPFHRSTCRSHYRLNETPPSTTSRPDAKRSNPNFSIN